VTGFGQYKVIKSTNFMPQICELLLSLEAQARLPNNDRPHGDTQPAPS
jgi:hypothetical protein